MSREYPMNPSPDTSCACTTLHTTKSMKAFELPGRGKQEIAPTQFAMRGAGHKPMTGNMPGAEKATPGKEYRQVTK